MKKPFIIIFYFLFAVFISCNSTAAGKASIKDQSTVTASPSDANKQDTLPKADGIVGEWKLFIETYDDNGNKALDDAERKKGFSNHYFYRFNADGSCLISPLVNNPMQNAFKGHYIITNENGRKILTNYLDEEEKEQREAQYTIVSVNKDELVLLETVHDHAFWIFKRSK